MFGDNPATSETILLLPSSLLHGYALIADSAKVRCMKSFRCYLVVILQILGLCAVAQKPKLRFERLGTDNGLSQSNVICMLQDARGFMWFGTNDGLNKYDGYNFTVYKTRPNNPRSISDNFITDLGNSGNGDIWIATQGGGVSYYDRRKDQFLHLRAGLTDTDTNAISSNDVYAILEDSEGKVWIGTSWGLDLYDPMKKKITHYKHHITDSNTLSDNYVTDILEDSDHNIWIATPNGLNLFDRKQKKFKRYLHQPGNPFTPGSNHILVLFEDSRKGIWIGTNKNGLEMLDKSTGRFEQYRHNPINAYSLSDGPIKAIKEDDQQRLWIGTENAGLSIFDPVKRVFYNYTSDEVDRSTLGSNSINAICRDTKNNMWVGSFNAGVNYVNPDAAKFTHYKYMFSENSLNNDHVLCFYEDSEKNIWIGTDGGGLNVFNPSSGRFSFYRHDKRNSNSLCGDNVLCVMEDSKGNIWAGTWGNGVSIFNKKKNTFTHLRHDPANTNSLCNDNAWTILEDSDKNIWIGTYGGGLDRYDPRTGKFTHFSYDERVDTGLRGDWINALYEDEDGNIWITTAGAGINIYNKKTGTFSYMLNRLEDNVNSRNLGCITEDRNKDLWISSTMGLYMLNRKSGKTTLFTTEQGLPSNVVHGVLEDKEGNLWISTAQGFSKYTRATGRFRNFTGADGLQSTEFKEKAFLKASDGSMYFGGNNGFNRFFPENVRNVSFDPPMVITNFQVFNKTVPIASAGRESPLHESITETKAITLPYSNSVFSFEFAALNYTTAEKKHYAYMLEGFDKTWNEVGTQRTATYTNLDPGKYVFKVKGQNNDGGWSRHTAIIHLTITPPFWLTWWFRLAVVAAVTGGVVLVYRLRVANIKKQKLQLEQQVQQQTLQLVQANKEMERKNRELEQFAYIASHDLQEPLRTTSSFVDLLKQHYGGKHDAKAEKYFTFITDSCSRMSVLIKDLLDYSRIGRKVEIQRVDCNRVLREVMADLDIAIRESKARIKSGPLPSVDGYPTELKQLMQNLVINAIKFRKKDAVPVIDINAKRKDDHWEFTVADNGIGIEQHHSERIFVIFQRLHTRNEYPGSGIGLSHCKKIVELHKGEIWVNSVPEQGSTFHFTIRS